MECGKCHIRGKYTILNVYIRREDKFKTNNLSFHLWTLGKGEHLN